MNKKTKAILILIATLFFFLGFRIIQAVDIENKLNFVDIDGDNMISLTRGANTYTISVGIDSAFTIKNGSSVVIFKIDVNGDIYFPQGNIKEGNILGNITGFPTVCPIESSFIYGINPDGTLKCRPVP